LEDRFQHRVGLEIGRATGEMYIPAGGEASFFVEDDADAPTLSHDRLVAVAALGLSASGLLGTVDTLDARVCDATVCRCPEALPIGYALGCLVQHLEKWLRTLVRRA